MGYEQMLTHRCTLYRIKAATQVTEYGVAVEQRNTYEATPYATDEPCYAYKSGRGTFVTQGSPNSVLSEPLTVHFLKDSGIQINDKVVMDGAEYIAKQPRLIRDHHIEVIVEQVVNL